MGIGKQVSEMINTGNLNYERGRFELLGIRGIIIPVPTFRFFLERVYEENPDKLFEMMFDAGKKHGEIAVEDVGRRNRISKKEFVDYIETANLMGMGKIEVEICDFESKIFRGTIKDSPLVEEFKKSETLSEIDKPIHHFWRGVFKAFSTELFDTEVVAEEKQCEFLGDEQCVIECREIDD